MTIEARPVQAPAAVAPGSFVVEHASPTDGAMAVHIDGGTISATVAGGATAANQTTEIVATQQLRGYLGAEVPVQSDTVDLATPAAGLYVGTGGTVKYDTWNHLGVAGGVRVTLTESCPDGTLITEPILRVWSSGTTASNFKLEF